MQEKAMNTLEKPNTIQVNPLARSAFLPLFINTVSLAAKHEIISLGNKA